MRPRMGIGARVLTGPGVYTDAELLPGNGIFEKIANVQRKNEQIESNQKYIRELNPGTKVQYPVEYASLDNNAVFIVARIINNLGYDIFDYEDIFKQDFLAAAGYSLHFAIYDEEYHTRECYDFTVSEKKPVKDQKNLTIDISYKYNFEFFRSIFPLLYQYCKKQIVSHAEHCVKIPVDKLFFIYNDGQCNIQYNKLWNVINDIVMKDKLFYLKTPFAITCKKDKSEYDDFDLFFGDIFIERMQCETFIYVCNLFDEMVNNLVADCCLLINQVRLNMSLGREPQYPIYNNYTDTTEQQQDITQEQINEMAATAEPELLDGLSVEKVMSVFQKGQYTDVEMDIVRYIVQDMIDSVKVV